MQRHGSKNLFCASRRLFLAEPRRHFSGRIFFQSCANTQKFRGKKEAIFVASFCTHPNTNIINEMIASSLFFFFAMKIDGKTKKKRKETARKMYWLCLIHSLETRRGRGRSCCVRADKTFASRATRKRKETCAYICEQSLPRQAQVILTATMNDVGIRCVDLVHVHVVLQLYFCSTTLFLLFEVRACCDSAVDFTCKKVFPSL